MTDPIVSNYALSIFEPTFLGYEARLKLNHAQYQVIRLDEHFEIPEEALSRFGKDDFVMLANPNNPSGTLLRSGVGSAAKSVRQASHR